MEVKRHYRQIWNCSVKLYKYVSIYRNKAQGVFIMKKISVVFVAVAAFTLVAFSGCSKKAGDGKLKIGIAKIVQHPALDQIEQAIQDRLNEAGIKAEYNLQNANGDVNTAAQIANLYKSEKVDVAIGIATPVAVALANTIKNRPVVFATVTDPVGAGLVPNVNAGYRNVTGLSDALPTVEDIALFKKLTGIKTLGYIYTSNEANSISSLEEVKKGCAAAGLELVAQSITNSSEVKTAAESIIDRVDGIYLTTDNTVFSALPALVEVFNKAKKPIYSADVTGAMNGGIAIASGFNYYKAGLATADIVIEILNGKKPADIPVKFMTEPSDKDLLFDMDALKACGIEIDQKLLDSANMIFENGKLTER